MIVCVPFLTSFVYTPQILLTLVQTAAHPVAALSLTASQALPASFRGINAYSPIETLGNYCRSR